MSKTIHISSKTNNFQTNKNTNNFLKNAKSLIFNILSDERNHININCTTNKTKQTNKRAQKSPAITCQAQNHKIQ